jgi:hypothetical protein
VSESTSRRLVGFSGLVAFVLSAVIGAIEPPPAVGATGAVVAEYFHAHRTQVLVLNYLGLVGLLPFFPVVAYTVALVREREGARGWLWTQLLSASLFMIGAGFGVLAVLQGTAYSAAEASPDLARALGDLSALWFGMFHVTLAGFLGAFGWAVLATRVWPLLFGYASLVVGALCLAASVGSVVTSGPLAAAGPVTIGAFGAFLLWMLAYSILIIARSPGGSPAGSSPLAGDPQNEGARPSARAWTDDADARSC